MDVQQTIERARDALTVKRVFGEPYEKDGTTIIPAARVWGGAGGGTGDSEAGTGSGGGFGIIARPVGAYVIRDGGDVAWRPAIDVTRIVFGAQALLALALLVRRSIKVKRAKLRARANPT